MGGLSLGASFAFNISLDVEGCLEACRGAFLLDARSLPPPRPPGDIIDSGLFFDTEARIRTHAVVIGLLQDIPPRCEQLLYGIATSMVAKALAIGDASHCGHAGHVHIPRRGPHARTIFRP